MEQLSEYQTLIKNITLDNNAPSMSSSIQSALSKTNNKLKHLTKMIFPRLTQDSLLFDLVNHKPKRHLKRNSILKKTQIRLYLSNRNIGQASTHLLKTNEKKILPFNSFNNATRNKTNHYLSNVIYKDYSSSFNKTQLNQSSLTKSTTITQKKNTKAKLCLYLQSDKMRQHQIEEYATNESPEAFLSSLPSPHPFSLNDSHMNMAIAQTNPCLFSSKLLKKQCTLIEDKCYSVDRAVKRYPNKAIRNKKKIVKLLNESNETINDLTDSKKENEDKDHLRNISLKTKRVLRETDWIQRINPNLALEANKTLKKMFSIKPTDKSKEDLKGKQIKNKFGRLINQMDDLLNKNLQANKKCSAYFTKVHSEAKKTSK